MIIHLLPEQLTLLLSVDWDELRRLVFFILCFSFSYFIIVETGVEWRTRKTEQHNAQRGTQDYYFSPSLKRHKKQLCTRSFPRAVCSLSRSVMVSYRAVWRREWFLGKTEVRIELSKGRKAAVDIYWWIWRKNTRQNHDRIPILCRLLWWPVQLHIEMFSGNGWKKDVPLLIDLRFRSQILN